MRMLIAIVMGCVLVLGLTTASSSGSSAPETQPAYEPSEQAEDATELQPQPEDGYECRYSPYCQKDSQCTAYCAGGIPVCFQGCCSCAS